MAYQWKAIARTHSVLSPFDSRSLSIPRPSFIGGAHERFPPLMKSSYKQSKGSLDFRFFPPGIICGPGTVLSGRLCLVL